MLELVDNIFRFGAVFSCMLIAALAMRDARCTLAGHLACLLAVTTATFLILVAPGVIDAIGLWMIPLEMVGLFAPAALWLFSLSLFDDNFTLKPVHGVIVAVFWLSGISNFPQYYSLFGEWPIMSPASLHSVLKDSSSWYGFTSFTSNSLKFGMVAHMLYTAWQGRDDDLLEGRRTFRSIFVLGGSLAVAVVVYSLRPNGVVPSNEATIVDATVSGIILFCVAYMLWNIIKVDSEWLLGDLAQATPKPLNMPQEPTDALDLVRLNDLAANATLLEQGLTITKLADIAKVPEHRLRRLINQHMGFRNFSDFLNHHRVEAAKNRLSDTQERHTPVLTIAMELGYGSLGPFNRAFKERTGQTPTEFRKGFLGGDPSASMQASPH